MGRRTRPGGSHNAPITDGLSRAPVEMRDDGSADANRAVVTYRQRFGVDIVNINVEADRDIPSKLRPAPPMQAWPNVRSARAHHRDAVECAPEDSIRTPRPAHTSRGPRRGSRRQDAPDGCPAPFRQPSPSATTVMARRLRHQRLTSPGRAIHAPVRLHISRGEPAARHTRLARGFPTSSLDGTGTS